jgi:hypothetical protein
VAAPGNALAAAGASYSVRPAHYDPGDPATRAYFKRDVRAGSSFTDSVIVSNGGSVAVRLLVYPVDGLTGQTSGSVYANRGVARRKAGRWLRVDTSRLLLEPGASVHVGFRVDVPEGAVAGDHLAGIAFQDANPTVSSGHFRIREVLREVIGVLVRVPGPAAPRLHLGRLSLRTLAGTGLASVSVGIGNLGRALCKPRLEVSLASGGFRQVVVRQLDTILPGDTIAYPLILPHDVEPGSYKIDAGASCAGSKVRELASVHLGTKLRGARELRAASPEPTGHGARGGLPVWALLGVAALAALLGLLAGVLVRLRRPTP